MEWQNNKIGSTTEVKNQRCYNSLFPNLCF